MSRRKKGAPRFNLTVVTDVVHRLIQDLEREAVAFGAAETAPEMERQFARLAAARAALYHHIEAAEEHTKWDRTIQLRF